MKILVANHHLLKTGGTENYTYALALELKRRGHDVEHFTVLKGNVSDILESKGIPYMSSKKYDLILANHRPCVRKLQSYGYVVQTCNGIVPTLEQPSRYADHYVSITEEVCSHLLSQDVKSSVILNGIDCERFSPQRPISEKLSCVLSLCQSDLLNKFIAKCCEQIGVRFLSCNKHTDNVWDLPEMINQADLVVGIGRSLYDAMACGRCVISYDMRTYINAAIGDGYLNADNFDEALENNCSGRKFRKCFDTEGFVQELLKYNPADGRWAREYALKHLNISHVADQYLSLHAEIERSISMPKVHKLKKILNIVPASVYSMFHKNK